MSETLTVHTVAAAAGELGISRNVIYHAIRAGLFIPSVSLDGRAALTSGDLQKLKHYLSMSPSQRWREAGR